MVLNWDYTHEINLYWKLTGTNSFKQIPAMTTQQMQSFLQEEISNNNIFIISYIASFR